MAEWWDDIPLAETPTAVSAPTANAQWWDDIPLATARSGATKPTAIPQGDILAKGFEAMTSLGDRRAVLGVLRSIPAERKGEFLDAAKAAAVHVEEEREVSIMIPSPLAGGLGDRPSGQQEPSGTTQASEEQNPFESRPPGGEQNPFEAPSAADNPFQPSPSGLPADFGGMQTQRIREKVLMAHDEPEGSIIREVTVGGLALLPDGLLKRTYSGRPPSLCPT